MSPAAGTLAFLQAELQAIYGVEAPEVGGYVVDRAGALAAGRSPRAPEELLVFEEGEDLSLGLFLDESILDAAARAEPHHRRPKLVTRALLDRLACAAEGVSHFVYLSSRAVAGRPVSLLELEVQGEVDKFALLLLHLWRRGLRRTSGSLRARLFERVRFRVHLATEELDRYREANRLGGGYARWLEARFVEEADIDGLLRELRQSYRRSGGDKLAYLGTRSVQ